MNLGYRLPGILDVFKKILFRIRQNKSISSLRGLTLSAIGWSKRVGIRDQRFSRKFAVLLAVAGLLFTTQHTTQLIIVSSPSLPGKVYLLVKGMTWKKGDVVSFQGHPSPYLQGRTPLLTKRVAGVEGDRLFYQKGMLYVGNQRIGRLLSQNSREQPLKATPSGLIPKGSVFMAGEDSRSFDSRYQEFGLVRTDHIVGRSFRLW